MRVAQGSAESVADRGLHPLLDGPETAQQEEGEGNKGEQKCTCGETHSSPCDGVRGVIYIEWDHELDAGRVLFRYPYELAEESRGFVPGHDCVGARRHARKGKPACGVCFGIPLIRTDHDGRSHVRMQMAVYEHDPGLGEGYGAGVVLWIVAQIK